MADVLTKEDIINWRRTTEKITLEEYARRLGKVVSVEKETNDLHDILSKKPEPQPEIKVIKEEIAIKEDIVEVEEIAVIKEEIAEVEEEIPQKPDLEIKITFKENLNKREEVVFNYFIKNKKKKVFANELANVLNLPNDYVYKYIRNLRKKLAANVLVNAENGGYILDI